jgi:hypothetical protein
MANDEQDTSETGTPELDSGEAGTEKNENTLRELRSVFSRFSGADLVRPSRCERR